MSLHLDAVQRCKNYGVDPSTGFKSQYVIGRPGALWVPGMTELTLNKFALFHGDALRPSALHDDKGRLFGVFFGTGVDRDGAVVTADRLARFNSRGRNFEKDLESYISGIAGRFILILDAGTKTRLYRDPMGHMPLFYNAKTKLAGSSISLALDHAIAGNPACAQPGIDPSATISVFPMGQTADTDTRLLPGHHMLNLADMTAHRYWPARNSIRKVTASKSGPVIDRIAARLRTVVQNWIAADDVVLPLDRSAGTRILLAAAGENRAGLSQITVLQPGREDDAATLSVAQMMADIAGVTLTPLTREDAIATMGTSKDLRLMRKRVFWLRTSSAMRVRTEVALAMDALHPTQHIVLNAAGLDALQGGWQAGTPKAKPIRGSHSAELTAAIGRKPDKALRDVVEDHYTTWKSSLPKSLQDTPEDFIRIELHEPAKAVVTLGQADHVHASPFSDPEVIELALKLPLSMRAGPDFAEALIAALDPALAGLPYDGAAQELAEAAE
ncbi:MAG: hypothetical protein AAF641_14280 [Pseudomonadota bacterium]